MSDAPVLSETQDGVTTITLNRPDALNGLTTAAKEALLEAVTNAAGDDAVRCVVLTGAGRAFCAGQDLKEHVALLQADDPAPLSTVEQHYNPIVTAVATMPKPVIAAVNGVAAGAGASLAFASDLRVLSSAAGFNLAFAGIALSCDTGSSWTLPQLIGPARALELMYFPRTVPADEALELGLATRVVEPDELASTVAELAGRLAAGPTVAYGAIRRSIRTAAGSSFTDALTFEAQMMALTGGTEDHRGAVESFIAKERPTFHGR